MCLEDEKNELLKACVDEKENEGPSNSSHGQRDAAKQGAADISNAANKVFGHLIPSSNQSKSSPFSDNSPMEPSLWMLEDVLMMLMTSRW